MERILWESAVSLSEEGAMTGRKREAFHNR